MAKTLQLLLFFALFPFFLLNAQVIVLDEDFEDQDLTQNPEWTGDLGDFTFFDDAGNIQLRLDGTSDRSQIHTPSSTAYGEWSFFIQVPATSSFNRVYMFLMSDDTELDTVGSGSPSNANGYAIHTGGGNFELVRVSSGNPTTILTSDTDIEDDTEYQVRVTRSEDNEWQIYVSEGYGSTPQLDSGTINDDTFTESDYFGLYVRYSGGNSNDFFFDDILIRDGIPPLELTNIDIESGNSLRAAFTEQVDETSIQTSDFELNGVQPVNAALDQDNQNQVVLEFSDGLDQGSNTLSVSNIDDFRGNTIEPVNFEFTISNPFFINSVDLADAVSIDLEFSEAPDEAGLTESAFSVNGVGSPESVEYDSGTDPLLVTLVFDSAFDDGDYELSIIENIRSINDWNLSGDTEFEFTVENPFMVSGFTALSNEEIDIIFTEDVEDSFLDDPSNFTVEGVGSPSNIESPAAGTVRLTFDPTLDAGEYQLTIGDIRSENQWPLSGEDEFEFTVFDQLQDGDLIITEFFYRVPTDWRTDEFDRPRYIEVYNRSDRFLNLRDFTINDDNISPDIDVPISPEEYLVITQGEPVFLEKFGERPFFEADEFPSLSLTTENEIVFKTDQEVVVDSLYYRAGDWGGNGVALERKSNSVSSIFRDNWGESEDALLGSPGLNNTVNIPEDAPEVVEITFPVPRELRVEFSRALSAEAVDELENFALSNEAVLGSSEYNTEDRREIVFELAENLVDQNQYTFTYQNVADIFGNEVVESIFEFNYMNPFRVASGEIDEGNFVLLEFTQPLNTSTVSVNNFQRADGTSPTNLEILNSENIRLEFSETFGVGSHPIIVNDIQSMIGWTIEDDTEFDVFVFDEYEAGDIIISEFMYNPPDGYTQYVEIHNISDKILNLRDWELRRRDGASNNGGIISETTLAIEPNGYLVITEDSTPLNDIFGTRPWVETDNFPGITITQPDAIRLFDSEVNLVEMIEYEQSAWGGNNIALERRSAEVSAEFVENWGESPAELLGTPGLPNEIQPDETPPTWENLVTFGNNVFILTFDERLDEDAALNGSNYSISPELTISNLFVNRNEVQLVVEEEFENEEVYELTVSNISDLFGNNIEEETRSVEYLEFEEAEPRQIVINEILYRRLEAGSPEFVEIFNRTDQNIDLSGWELADASGSTQLPAGTAIRGNEYLVFTDMESFAAESDQIIYLSGFQSLSNSGDAVVLRNENEVVIDSLFYQPTWGDNEQGVSLERRDPDAISVDPANWLPSTAESGSTPAAENSRLEPDETPPQVVFANLFHPDSLEVRFSEFVDLQQLPSNQQSRRSGFEAFSENGSTRFLVNDQEADILEYNPNRANRIVLDASGVETGEEITLQIENFGDFQGNIQASQSQPIAQPVQEGDLVFNEIMFDPIRDNREGLTNQTEYIEIVNTRDYAISAEGIFLHDRPDENNDISSIRPVSTSSRWIPANGVLLLHAEDATNIFNESRTAVFFDLDESVEQQAIRVNRSTLSLPLSGREVYLADSTRTVLDMVDYRPDWHNPNLIDTRGIALERVSPTGETNNPANWSSSAATLGGTPGSQNSIYQESEGPLAETGISLTPNPFSPDGDGHEDNLFINYRFDEPDYLLRVRIYDRYGRLVRTLVDSHQAGFEGSLIWDGLTDDGQRNRIGIYIVYVEAYNSSTGSNRNFRETAVLARQF